MINRGASERASDLCPAPVLLSLETGAVYLSTCSCITLFGNLGTHPIHSCLLFPQWVIHTALVIYESSESSPYMDRLRHCQSVPWAIIELMFLELDCSQVNQKCSQAGQMGPDGSPNTSSDHPATKPPVDTRRL